MPPDTFNPFKAEKSANHDVVDGDTGDVTAADVRNNDDDDTSAHADNKIGKDFGRRGGDDDVGGNFCQKINSGEIAPFLIESDEDFF